jgi:hypothetical protein
MFDACLSSNSRHNACTRLAMGLAAAFKHMNTHHVAAIALRRQDVLVHTTSFELMVMPSVGSLVAHVAAAAAAAAAAAVVAGTEAVLAASNAVVAAAAAFSSNATAPVEADKAFSVSDDAASAAAAAASQACEASRNSALDAFIDVMQFLRPMLNNGSFGRPSADSSSSSSSSKPMDNLDCWNFASERLLFSLSWDEYDLEVSRHKQARVCAAAALRLA